MAFAMPEPMTKSARATATWLRQLEQDAPKTTQREIRDALTMAAQELEHWAKLADTAARQLEEAATVRISQMATTSRVEEVQQGVRRTLLDLARTFRELA